MYWNLPMSLGITTIQKHKLKPLKNMTNVFFKKVVVVGNLQVHSMQDGD
jgi:hypothetical protein